MIVAKNSQPREEYSDENNDASSSTKNVSNSQKLGKKKEQILSKVFLSLSYLPKRILIGNNMHEIFYGIFSVDIQCLIEM